MKRLIMEWSRLVLNAGDTGGLYYSYPGREHARLLKRFTESGEGWPTLDSMRSVDVEITVGVRGVREVTMRKVRRSQIVSPFGPGAIIDLVGESFVAEDAGNWRGRPVPVGFPRLAAYLRVRELRTPRRTESAPLLPLSALAVLHLLPADGPVEDRIRSSRTRPRPARPAGEASSSCPMRFVAVCGNGHLTDVDWGRWAHSAGPARPEPAAVPEERPPLPEPVGRRRRPPLPRRDVPDLRRQPVLWTA